MKSGAKRTSSDKRRSLVEALLASKMSFPLSTRLKNRPAAKRRTLTDAGPSRSAPPTPVLTRYAFILPLPECGLTMGHVGVYHAHGHSIRYRCPPVVRQCMATCYNLAWSQWDSMCVPPIVWDHCAYRVGSIGHTYIAYLSQ